MTVEINLPADANVNDIVTLVRETETVDELHELYGFGTLLAEYAEDEIEHRRDE